MVISSKLRRQITNSNLFLSVWASSARTGLTGMGDRSKPSWRFWAPQHLNHSPLSPNDSFIPPAPIPSLSRAPSSLKPSPPNPSSPLDYKGGESFKSVEDQLPHVLLHGVTQDRKFFVGEEPFKVNRLGLDRSLVLDGFR